MMLRALGILAFVLGVSLGWGQDQAGTPPEHFSSAYMPVPGTLTVFSRGKEAVSVPIPFPMRHLVYGPDGRSLYAQPMEPGACLYRIGLSPETFDPVACPPGLRFEKFAVSPKGDKLLFAGGYGGGQDPFCGLFEVSLPGGIPRPVLKADCGSGPLKWNTLSLSPDGKKAVATVKEPLVKSLFALEVIELDSSSVKSLGSGFLLASWSPDGRWIAAVRNGGKYKTELLDPVSFKKVRTLPNSEGEWSPDGRFLLRVADCSEYFGKIEAIDVENGTVTPMRSSECKIGNVSTGWVSDTILPEKATGPG